MPRLNVTNLIFDMDDTLSECSPFYAQCKENFVKFSNERTGIQKDVIAKILDGIDVACTNLPTGFGKERFPRSFAAASAALDIIQGNAPDDFAAEQSYLLGNEVFHAEYPLYSGVTEMLQMYKDGGHNLFLCTKGDYSVQHEKIVKNGLDKIFDKDHIYIVPKKNGLALERILLDHQLDPTDTAMIGDSIRDDIGAAHEAHILGVWVENHNKRAWAYEDKDHTPDHIVAMVTELPNLINYDALPFAEA